VAERVEDVIDGLDGAIEAVHSHLEPLEGPVALRQASRRDRADLETVVERLLGRAPLDFQLRTTDAGPVLFLSIAVEPDADLAEAHELASRLESELRTERPALAEVVVHTEPGTVSAET
jgi:divalent metal cation (Fe/Co/Zn/Cd) transporter